MPLSPAEVKAAFQNAIPRRRDEFANRVRERHDSIAFENQYVTKYPLEVLAMAEAELRDRVTLAADRVKQLINSGWTADETTPVRSVFLGMFAGFDGLDKDPQSDLYNAVENAFADVGRHDPAQAALNARRLSQVQVQAANEFLSDLEVYYGEKHPTAAAPATQLATDKAAVAESAAHRWEYDVFICHASEDKPFVRDLAERLTNVGISVWYDEFTLTIGDSLHGKIDSGLKSSRYGIVVLSRSFFGKQWPELELGALVATQADANTKVVLPVWHDITASEVLAYSPILAGVVAAKSADGMEKLVSDLVAVLRPGLEASLPATPDAVAPSTFRAQVFQFVTDARNLVLKYGSHPSSDEIGNLLIDYSQTMAKRFYAIKHHLQAVLGFAKTQSLYKAPLPMTPGAILKTIDMVEKLGQDVAVDLPAYPPELDDMT